MSYYGLLMFVVIVLSNSQPFVAFNLDAEFPTFISPLESDQSFGYSVDYQVNSYEAWIIVGAPGASPNGKVFKCRYYKTSYDIRNCEVINITPVQSATNGARLGSTVAIGRNNELLACAPLFTIDRSPFNDIHSASPSKLSYFITGICYFSEDFTQRNPLLYVYLPYIHEIERGQLSGEGKSNCQLGSSAAFSTDNSKILLGAVGSNYGQGSLMLIQGDLARNISNLPIGTPEFKPNVPEGQTEREYLLATYDNNYMGYSVATGYTTAYTRLLVASAPRRFGRDLLGAVVVYDESLRTVLSTFTGEQIGEYFGHGLAVVDLNGDNLDDIVVGSPFYSNFANNQPELGRIYIFYQLRSNALTVEFSKPIIIAGNAIMGRFGSTIASLGDVNDDGYKDIVVSAPHERNDAKVAHGAVYVFNGGREGLRRLPSQVIHGKNLTMAGNGPNTIGGLGYSAKGSKDMDNNGYPDLILGAHFSDQAVLIRARPVVKVHITSDPTPRVVKLEDRSCSYLGTMTCFRLQSCFWYNGKKLPTSMKISYSYDVDSTKPIGEKRSFAVESSVRNLSLATGGSQCFNEEFYIKNVIQDKFSPILVKIFYWIAENHQPVYPILDATSSNDFTTQVDLFKDCGADNICAPDLQLSLSTKQGSFNTQVRVTSTIRNFGENAYIVQLVVKYPNSTVIISDGDPRYPLDCRKANHLVTCEFGNPIKTNDEVVTVLTFQIVTLQLDFDKLEFEAWTVYENKHKSSVKAINFNMEIQAKKETDIFTASTPEFILLQRPLTGGETQSVTHFYEITNTGPFKIRAATVYISWPILRHGDENYFPLDDIVASGPISCKRVPKFSKDQIDTINRLHASPTGSLSTGRVFNCNPKSGPCEYLLCEVEALEPECGVQLTLKGRLSLDYFRQKEDGVVTSALMLVTLEQSTIDGNVNRKRDLREITVHAVEPLSPLRSTSDYDTSDYVVGILILVVGGIVCIRIVFRLRKRYVTKQPTSDFSDLLDQTLYGDDAINMFNLKL